MFVTGLLGALLADRLVSDGYKEILSLVRVYEFCAGSIVINNH